MFFINIFYVNSKYIPLAFSSFLLHCMEMNHFVINGSQMYVLIIILIIKLIPEAFACKCLHCHFCYCNSKFTDQGSPLDENFIISRTARKLVINFNPVTAMSLKNWYPRIWYLEYSCKYANCNFLQCHSQFIVVVKLERKESLLFFQLHQGVYLKLSTWCSMTNEV